MPDKNSPSKGEGIAMFVAFDRATNGDLCHTMIQTLLTASGDAAATANE